MGNNSTENTVESLMAENAKLKADLETSEQMIDDLQKENEVSASKALPKVRVKGGSEYQFVIPKFKLLMGDKYEEFTAEAAAKNKEVIDTLLEMKSGVLEEVKN